MQLLIALILVNTFIFVPSCGDAPVPPLPNREICYEDDGTSYCENFVVGTRFCYYIYQDEVTPIDCGTIDSIRENSPTIK